MSVEQHNVIDYIIEDKDGKKSLIICDHHEWIDGDLAHLYLLQEKINAYLNAVESNQLSSYYPLADNGFRIKLICKYAVNQEGEAFLSRVKEFLAEHGYDFEYTQQLDS